MFTEITSSQYNEVDGDLIVLAKEGMFDVIAHGCNCFCRMKRGVAVPMAEAFRCDKFDMENAIWEGNYNKLGQIDYEQFAIRDDGYVFRTTRVFENTKTLVVVNAYTQYEWSTEKKPFDYTAFRLCCKKLAHYFKGLHLGIPKIGSHLAGGDWGKIKSIILEELCPHMKVTVVNFVQ